MKTLADVQKLVWKCLLPGLIFKESIIIVSRLLVHVIGSWASILPLSLYFYMYEFGEVLLSDLLLIPNTCTEIVI